MTNWMDQLIGPAELQGFEVRQTGEATWIFRKGTVTVTHRMPTTASEWLSLIGLLRRAGLVFPPE
jgi:hypothetical protein